MDFLTYLAKEGAVIWQAPVTFLIAVVLAGLVAFALARWAYATRLEHSQSTITMLEKRLDRAEQSDAIAIAATVQATKYDPGAVTDAIEGALARLPPGKREFLPATVTLEFLISLFEDRTDLQAQGMLNEYLGKWTTITGTVRNVNQLIQGALVAMPFGDGHLIFCAFTDVGGLDALSPGDRITVIGRLDSADSRSLSFEDCELVPQREG